MIHRANLNGVTWVVELLTNSSTVVNPNTLYEDVYGSLYTGVGYVISNNECIWIYNLKLDYVSINYFCVQ